jgi:hypothetical protein
MEPDPPVGRGQEPRQGSEAGAGRDAVQPQEALAAERHADVPSIHHDGPHPPVDRLQLLSGQALCGDSARRQLSHPEPRPKLRISLHVDQTQSVRVAREVLPRLRQHTSPVLPAQVTADRALALAGEVPQPGR